MLASESVNLTVPANLHLVNGLGSTDCTDEQGEPIPDCPNGVGNLIVGYNESRVPSGGEDIRTGSHTVVVGEQHNFSRVGGLVVGAVNTLSADSTVVSGAFNTASGSLATVSGGLFNIASGNFVAVNGGQGNMASGNSSSVSGGFQNTARGEAAVVSGGVDNTAFGNLAVVSGGQNITQDIEFGWAAGSEADEGVGGNFRSP
jgi:hypothetical protein